MEKVNSFIWKIKPLVKLLKENNCTKKQKIPIEVLEKGLIDLCMNYGYISQGILTSCDEKEKRFMFYSASILRRSNREWLGTVMGKTLWEVMAKQLIKVYSEIRKEQEENN